MGMEQFSLSKPLQECALSMLAKFFEESRTCSTLQRCFAEVLQPTVSRYILAEDKFGDLHKDLQVYKLSI